MELFGKEKFRISESSWTDFSETDGPWVRVANAVIHTNSSRCLCSSNSFLSTVYKRVNMVENY